MSYRRQLANWRSRVPVLSTAGAVPVRTEKGEMYLEKVKVKRYVAGKRPDFGDTSGGGGGEADSDYDDDQQVEPHRHQRLSAAGDDPFVRPRREPAAVVGGHQAAFVKPELTADPRDRRLQRLLAASSGGARAGRRSLRAGDEDDDDSEYGDEDEASDSEDSEEEEEDRLERHRRYRGEAVAESGGYDHHHHHQQQQQRGAVPANEDDEEQLDEAELEHRRSMLRMRAKQREVEEELMARQEERGAAGSGSSDAGSDDDEELTEEEYTSDEDEAQPRLKPVFVRRRDRVTVGQGDAVSAAVAPAAPSSTAGGISRIAAAASTVTPVHVSEERRATTLQLVRQEARQEAEEAKALAAAFDNVDSADEEDDEVAYEAWKLRELKRLKRDREEREARQREQEELQRVRNMTEEERQAELRRRPKIIDNKADKGKYKYLQKYYHRGAFFLDGDNDLLRRDVSGPTLEDHFDKSVLPKVMQVKNFGRAGRTKYTHLVDQDTTGTDNPWAVDSAQAQRFHSVRGGGMRPLTHHRSGAKRSDV